MKTIYTLSALFAMVLCFDACQSNDPTPNGEIEAKFINLSDTDCGWMAEIDERYYKVDSNYFDYDYSSDSIINVRLNYEIMDTSSACPNRGRDLVHIKVNEIFE